MSPTGSRPPSRNRNSEMPGDEELGFEASVAALGKFVVCRNSVFVSQYQFVNPLHFFHISCMVYVCSSSSTHFLLYPSSSLHSLCPAGMKTTVSEAEHPLLCEGTRRVKGDLALALMITYKDDQSKLKKVKAGLWYFRPPSQRITSRSFN